MFYIFRTNTELGDGELEFTVIRGIQYHLPNGKYFVMFFSCSVVIKAGLYFFANRGQKSRCISVHTHFTLFLCVFVYFAEFTLCQILIVESEISMNRITRGY